MRGGNTYISYIHVDVYICMYVCMYVYVCECVGMTCDIMYLGCRWYLDLTSLSFF